MPKLVFTLNKYINIVLVNECTVVKTGLYRMVCIDGFYPF